MAEVKRVNDQYTISVPLLIIDGDLTVQGNTTSVETTNSAITDNVLLLNSGEPGSGITLGSSGIELDRGAADNASFVYEESESAFSVYVGNSLTNLRALAPTEDTHVVNKEYIDNLIAGITIGSDTQVIFNDSGSLTGSNDFTWTGSELNIGDISINAAGSIFTTATNLDLEFSANGTGSLYFRSVLKLENTVSDPIGIAGHNQLYAKAVGAGGTGIYFSNTSNSDEMISKRRALLFGMIF